MPDIRDEYRIIVESAGWIERPGRGRLRLDGADVASFLQALLSNDVSHVAPGQGVHATYLTPTGRMLADLEIYRRAGDWLVGLAAERAPVIAEKLDQSIFAEDVRVADVTATTAEIVVTGGAAAAVAGQALGVASERLDALAELEHLAWNDGFVARLGDSTLPMFTIVVPVARRQEVASALDAAGVRSISVALVEALRIDAGRPRFGADMTEDTIPLEAGLLDRAISTTKGCYVGQEIVIRILHRGGGRVAKRLMTMTIDEPPDGGEPARGASLLDEGKVVGHLTSVSPSLRTPGLIALGYAQRDAAEIGRRFGVADTSLVATVTGVAR